MIDPDHTRVTTNLEKRGHGRGETEGGETEIQVSPAQGVQEARRPENNRTERGATGTVGNTVVTTGGKRRRAKAGVEGILARNKFFSPLCYLYSL